MTLALLLLSVIFANAQMMNPVKFSSQLKTNSTAEGEIIFSGKIDAGWHVYSTNLGNDGPISASFNVNKLDGVTLVGKLTPRGHEISKFDNMFNMKLRFFEGSVQFVQKVKFTKPIYNIDAYLEYGACNDQNCMPPTSVEIKQKGKSPAVSADAKTAADADKAATDPAAAAALAKAKADSLAALGLDTTTAKVDTASAAKVTDADMQSLWKPVISQMQANDGIANQTNRS